MKPILVFLLLIATGTASADAGTRDKLDQLRTALDGVRQEQQSVYQSYQMTRELRLTEVQEGMPPRAQQPYGTDLNTPPPNYDDVVRAQLERERRIQEYTDTLKGLSVRYLELEEKRKELLMQIRELERHADE
jgi:hypothetical protein